MKIGFVSCYFEGKVFYEPKSFQIILQSTDKAMEDVKKCLTVLNNVLLTKTFLVGERVSLADISVGCNLLMLYKQVCDNSDTCICCNPQHCQDILCIDLYTFLKIVVEALLWTFS